MEFFYFIHGIRVIELGLYQAAHATGLGFAFFVFLICRDALDDEGAYSSSLHSFLPKDDL